MSEGSDPRLMVVAGEASGDRHAAGLIAELRELLPGLRCEGVGGTCLEREGADLLHRAEELGVVGISEVFARLPAIWRALRDLRRRLRERPPSALLLVDFPDFNLMLARTAAGLGIPVLYYISPQLWAWREGRVKKIRRRVRRMLVLFAFEEEFYRRHQVPVSFVGHPLAETARRRHEPEQARARLGLPAEGPVFGLLPGSRRGEIDRHLVPLLDAAGLALEAAPAARFVLPAAPTLEAADLRRRTEGRGLPLTVVEGRFADAIDACDAALVASGTATLEVALHEVPPVVVYRTSGLTWIVGRMAVRVPHVSLVNLVAGREVVPELLQGAFTPRAAADELLRVGLPGPDRQTALGGLRAVRRELGPPGAYRRAAEAVARELAGGEPARRKTP